MTEGGDHFVSKCPKHCGNELFREESLLGSHTGFGVHMKKRSFCALFGLVVFAGAASALVLGQDPAPRRLAMKPDSTLKPPAEKAMPQMSVVQKMELVKKLGLRVPPGGLQSAAIFSTRNHYKGQIGYLRFFSGIVDPGVNRYELRGGNLELILNSRAKKDVLAIVTLEVYGGGGKFGYANLGPGEMGDAATYIDVVGNGMKRVPILLECKSPGVYRIRFSVNIGQTVKMYFHQIELSLL